ncbi:MAG: hypothetical protein K2M45_09545 [Muribaculaceae bacterium]|nr:hypothetical protein [Muribaculaceae bacterium]
MEGILSRKIIVNNEGKEEIFPLSIIYFQELKEIANSYELRTKLGGKMIKEFKIIPFTFEKPGICYLDTGIILKIEDGMTRIYFK